MDTWQILILQNPCYKVNFNTGLDLDIPHDMRRTDQYCTTLAHKANHSFRPNTRWGRMDHPRFGLVVTLLAMREISVGEEITVNYNYSLSVAPAWYRDCVTRQSQCGEIIYNPAQCAQNKTG